MNLITQDASKTGKGIRTIALRLTGTKEAAEELEEMGEDTSDMIMSQSKMRDLIMNATKVASNNYQGFDIQDELGRYKSTYEIMLGLAQIWDEIQQADFRTGDNRQNLLLESIAGKNRASIAASILQNPKTLQSVYEDSSTKAAGSAMEENQKYMESISGHLAKLKNAWQEMWANAANRDTINMFIDLGTTILNVINEVGGLQSAFALLYGGTILKGLMSADSLLVKFVSRLDEAKATSQTLGDVFNTVFTRNKSKDEEGAWFKGLTQIQKQREQLGKSKGNPEVEAGKQLIETQEEVNDILEEANGLKEESIKISEGKAAAETTEAVVENTNSTANIKGAVSEKADATATEDNTEKTIKNTGATIANTEAEEAQTGSKVAGAASQGMDGGATGLAALASSPMTWLLAIPAIIGVISAVYGAIKKQQQELIDNEKEAASTWEKSKTTIDEYAQKYQDLHAQLQNTNLSEQEQADIKKQIYDLQKQITDEYGHAADGVSLVNGELDVQLAKLRQIKAEEARKNLLNNEKEYQNAQKEMEAERTYDMIVSRNAPATDQAKQILDKYGYELKQRSTGMGTIEQYIEFKGDASDAEQALQDLFDEVGNFSEDERTEKGLQTFFTSITAATERNNKILRDHQEAYNSFLEEKIFANDNVYGDAQQTAGEVLIELEDAVNDYNIALQSGDTSQIEKTQKAFEDLKNTVGDITDDMGEVYSRPFDSIIDKVNSTAETAYNFQKKMDDPKVHSMAESVFGDLAENKKISKETQEEILDTAGEILSMQKELAKAGLTDIISPLYDPIDKEYNAKFGNIDLNNRPTLTWNKGTLKKYQSAWNSWNWGEMPFEGDISTVLGASGEFGKAGYEIAFTPLLETDGKLELLDKDTVTNYLNDIVDEATKSSGEVDAKKLLTLDADPKSGKKLIAAYGKAAQSYDKIMHYVGTDGAYTTALNRLKKLADDNGLSVDKMLSSMAELGNRSGIRDMFKDTLPSITDVRTALEDTTGQFKDLQDFAEQQFEITLDSPDSDIEAFINSMQLAGLVATGAAEEAKQSLDDVFADVSKKIEKVSSLGSIVQKGLGQGGLTFTKLLDEQGNIIESDVSKIRDAYQSMYDFDLGSLFEETATGIKLNMDAYRQLAQEEEASTKIQLQNQRDLLEARQKTLEKLGAPDAQIRKLQEQITELDMLATAYDGATSATAKYLAQQNAADYGDAYEMFRDTTVKRADELMGKGMIGTEEFRTIAQLFSYDSLATASADKVLEAYQKGYNTVSKYITEDATVGMQTFLDDLVALPEEYGKFTKDAAGNYMIEFTDAQEDKLAEHLNVSKDMLESFYDMLNALGFNIHFFRDGTLNEFDKLNQNINDSKQRLQELKENANDPNLIPDDVLDFNIEDLNTVEQLEDQLNELKALDIDPKVNPQEYEAWKDLLDQIQEKIDKVTEAEIDPTVSLKDYEVADDALEVITQKTEQAQKVAEKGFNVKAAVENDGDIDALANKIANFPKQIQEYMKFTYSTDPEEIKRQLTERISGVEIPLNPVISPEAPQELQQTVDLWSNRELLIGVGADTTQAEQDIRDMTQNPSLSNYDAQIGVQLNHASAEAAKQEAENTIASAEPEIKGKVRVPDPDDFVWQGASNGEIHVNLEADPSDAQKTIESVRKEAEEPTETPLQFIPKNSVQEAANQAGAQQGVTTTSTETKVTNEETHATVTTDTSQLDAMNQKIQSVQAMNGSSVSIGMDVSGSENIETAKTNVDELVQKDGSKVTVSVNGNASIFNKVYAQINSALTTLAAKKTEPKITADNSNLKSKVSDSKEKLSSIKDKPVKITASQSGFSTISNWKNSVYDHLGNKDIYIRTHYSSTGTQPKSSPFQGSAHNQGTIISKGHAYASGTLSGDWGLPKAEKGALVNELGEEVIVTPDGHWQILNGGDPTFANLPKGSIIFNHKQSESLLKKGYINGSHGKMVGGAFANGTVDEDEDINEDELFEETAGNAFAAGTAKWNGQLSGTSHAGSGGGSLKSAKTAQKKSSSSSKSSSSKKKSSGSGKKSSGKSSSSNKNAKDFLQTLDGIEIRLNRIDTLIAQLDANAGKTYSTFAQRSQALASDLSTVTTEINAINASLNGTSASTNYLLKAAQAAQQAGLKSGDEGYKKGAANNVGKALSQDWINRIQNSVNSGTYMTINDVKDEGLWKKIQAYQTWYEKYLNLQKKKQEQVNKLSQLTIQQLQLIQTQWDTILNSISADITNNQNQIDLALEKGYDASEKFYNNQITLNKSRLTDLNQEATELQNKLNSAVSSGLIQKGSEEWYKWQTQIANVRNEIINTNKEIVRLANEIRQIRWDKFERGQESLSDLAEELEFLNGLIYENDQFTKEGVITDKGRASMGLIAMQYDEYVKQAEQYKNEVLKLNAEIAKDPNNNKLIEQRNEWLKAQQTVIENTRKQKEAMADLIENGIKKQIDAMNELIDKYEDALDAEKDQQKYAEDIADRQKKINSLQKQLRAMENDDSEEGRSRRQKLRDELKDAQKDLKDSQEDQRLSDIKDTLSDMQEKYEETLNARLDNIDALFAESITSVNQNGATIINMINAVGNSVNYNLSAILSAIVNNSGVTNNASDNSSHALVSGTNDTNGKINNAQAATIKSTPTPVVPNPEPVATSSSATTATTTVNKPATTTTTTKPVTTTTTTAKAPTVKNGFVDEGGQTYYYKNNAKQTGWQTINGKKFYFSVKDGHMLTGVQKIGNKYHLLYESTTASHKKGQKSETANTLYNYNGHTYYFNKGEMQTGWHNMKEGRRYFSVKNGQMLTGLQKIGNHSYYLDPKTGVAKTGTFKISGNTYVADKDGKITKKNGKTVKGALAKGKANVLRSGMYRVDEQGEEVFINKQGKIYTRLNKGTTVLPHDAAVNLLKGMSNPTEFIMSHMDMRPNKNITTTNNNTNGDTVNYITFKMDGVTNYTEFMREAQKDPNFTKYIQEISIGKLNGNNSLKGNSIRFR